MSKERELLEELSVKDMVSYYYPDLIDRIKDLLAQPEPEPEPEAWRYKTHNRYTYAETNYHEIEGEPLYTSPPKREPLSNDKIIVPEWMISKDERQAFVIGVKYAEKAHGIGVDNE